MIAGRYSAQDAGFCRRGLYTVTCTFTTLPWLELNHISTAGTMIVGRLPPSAETLRILTRQGNLLFRETYIIPRSRVGALPLYSYCRRCPNDRPSCTIPHAKSSPATLYICRVASRRSVLFTLYTRQLSLPYTYLTLNTRPEPSLCQQPRPPSHQRGITMRRFLFSTFWIDDGHVAVVG